MASTFAHNRRYRPPFPTLAITLRSPDSGRSSDELVALADTGADMTSVPIRFLKTIEAPEADEVRLRSHWGHSVNVVTYLVDIVIGNRTVPMVEVAGDTANEEIVLGRDVINQLLLLIDGPLATTSILDKRPR